MREMLNAEIWSVVQTNQGNAILLRPQKSGIVVPIFIGQLETQSILIAREGISLPRPMTHDLLLSVLVRLELNLERIEIHELKNNTFHARMVITGKEFSPEAPLVLDSRPSDAIALAVRCNCPIRIDPSVIEQAGIPLDLFLDATLGTTEEGEETDSPAGSGRRQLLEQLNQAVAAEEYERAAEIRDILIRLDEEGKNI